MKSAQEEVESILNRKLKKEETDPIIELTHVGKLLAMVLVDDSRPPWIKGFDAAAVIHWMGLRTLGKCVHLYDVDWICVPNVYKAMHPLPGRKIGRLFLSLDGEFDPCVSWIPTGIRIMDEVNADMVRENATRIEEIAEASVALHQEMSTVEASSIRAAELEEQMYNYGRELKKLCRKPEVAKCQA